MKAPNFLRITVAASICVLWAQAFLAQSTPNHNSEPKSAASKVVPSGDSVLETKVGGKKIRIVLTTYKIDIGTPSQTPPPTGESKNNCTYSSFPCSQVSNVKIWISGKKLFVPRSVFADCTDVGNMSVAREGGINVMTLVGGDASESYTLKVYFDSKRVKKRELHDLESSSLLEVTTYLPLPVLN